MIQVDDLLGEKVAVNLPGTDRERPIAAQVFARDRRPPAPAARLTPRQFVFLSRRRLSPMHMAVVQIGVMGMGMNQPLVAVGMGMRLGHRSVMAVPVVLVVDMNVLVLPFLVDMVVFVPFGEMGPQAEAHQRAGDEQLDGRLLVQEGQRGQRADEGREREIGPGARRAEPPEGENVKDEADADPEQPDQSRRADQARPGASRRAQGRRNIDRAGRQPLDRGDRHRIGRGQSAGEILSIPQARQAPATSSEPLSSASPRPCQDRTTAPARMAIAPANRRASRFSRKTSQAIAMVARPSRLSSSEALAAPVAFRPVISSKGPSNPPKNTTAASHGRSARRRGASGGGRPTARRPR